MSLSHSVTFGAVIMAAVLATVALSASSPHSWLTLREGPHFVNLPLLTVPPGRDKGFDLGFAIGQTFASQIKQGMALDQDYAKAYKWVQENPVRFQNLISRITAAFPEYIDEIRGMAKGSGVNYTDLLILNVRSDIIISIFPSSVPREEQCSDLLSLLQESATFVHGHNEDGNSYYKDKSLSYLVQTSTYLGYHYPGQIAGRAFGVNKYGLTFGVNSLEPVMTNLDHGIGMSFVLRSLYEAVDLNNALTRLNAYPVVRGFSANVASLHEKACFNLEMAADGFSIKRLNQNLAPPSPVLPHFNAYIHLNTEQQPSPSSVHRMARYKQLKPKTLTDIINFLGDTEDPKYPVYRDDTDGTSTLATIIATLSDGVNQNQLISIYFDNPKNQKPVYVFNFVNVTNLE